MTMMDGTENPARPARTWPDPEDDSDRKLLEDVRSFGWHLTGVAADEEGPAFVYSVGLYESFRHPELIVFGLPVDTLFQMINALGDEVQAGARFDDGVESDGALEEYLVTFRTVDRTHYREYLGCARWFYQGNEFPALQCLWPDTKRRYPFDPEFEPNLRGLQPPLYASP
jgi:hypothetical protein